MRWWKLVVVGACVGLPGVGGGVVAAQVAEDALVAGGRGSWMLGTVLTREDAAALVDAAGLNDSQAEAVGQLIDGARERLAANRRRYHREYYAQYRKREIGEVEDQAMYARLEELERDARAEAMEVERALMGDLKAVLTSEQEAGWEKFVRARRRAQLGYSGVEPNLDVTLAVRAIEVDVKGRAEVAAALETYEREVDAALVAWRRVADTFDETQHNRETPQDDRMKAYRAMLEGQWVLQQAQARGFRAVMGRLTEEEQQKLMRMRIRSAGRMMNVSADMNVAELLRFDGLSALQQERMRKISEEAEKAWTREMIKQFAKADDATLAATSAEHMESRDNFEEASKVSAKLVDQLIKDLVAVLTPNQKTRYDAGMGVREDGSPGMDESLRMPTEQR